ncbi:hypothetical protein [Paraburkholderia nodosa]|uniref:hypothetical protein n=1 Tax=Paraburkholderia nodosa TaxID=392320 RepID=UPI0004879F79|nr:hypothetical protein [Paraburkholderia nodosa]
MVLVIPSVEPSTPEGNLLCYASTLDALERFFNRVLAHLEQEGAFEANMPRFTPAKLDILCHPALEGFEVTRVDCLILYDQSARG